MREVLYAPVKAMSAFPVVCKASESQIRTVPVTSTRKHRKPPATLRRTQYRVKMQRREIGLG